MANRRIAKKRKMEVGKTADTSVTAALAEAAMTVTGSDKEVNVYIQYQGRELAEQEIAAEIFREWNALGNDEANIRKMDVYIKPEESKAYYVINEEHSGCVRI